MKPIRLLAKEIRRLLIGNGAKGRELDHLPVLKIFDPGGQAMWLITEVRPDDPDLMYGLIHDPGEERGPELGYMSFKELMSRRGCAGEPFECDPRFVAQYPISVYAVAVRIVGHLSDDFELLNLAASSRGIKPLSQLNAVRPKGRTKLRKK